MNNVFIILIEQSVPVETTPYKIEDIENNYPEDRFTLSTNTFFNENWNLVARATYYGSHFDERGTINGPLGNRSSEIDPISYATGARKNPSSGTLSA